MKKIFLGKTILVATFLFWLLESWWFGWNMEPINELEKACDKLVNIGYLLGLFLYASSVLSWIESKIAKDEQAQNNGK
jgi:hypothetical protein